MRTVPTGVSSTVPVPGPGSNCASCHLPNHSNGPHKYRKLPPSRINLAKVQCTVDELLEVQAKPTKVCYGFLSLNSFSGNIESFLLLIYILVTFSLFAPLCHLGISRATPSQIVWSIFLCYCKGCICFYAQMAPARQHRERRSESRRKEKRGQQKQLCDNASITLWSCVDDFMQLIVALSPQKSRQLGCNGRHFVFLSLFLSTHWNKRYLWKSWPPFSTSLIWEG